MTRQEADCRTLCEREGWKVVAVHTDNDLGAYTGKPRPSWERIAATVRDGHTDVLVGWHPDRFTRHPRELEDLIDLLDDSGVRVATVTAGAYDLSTPSGRMVARMFGAQARFESEHKAERQRSANRQAALEGKLTGRGRRPFGYTADRRQVRPGEAVLVREAAARALAGEPPGSIARDWNNRGIKTGSDGPWRPGGLRDMLTSPHLAGLRTHYGEVVAKAVWEPILDEVTHRRLVRLLADPSRRRTTGREYPLTGILLCGRCGERTLMGHFRQGSRRYVCRRDPGTGGCGSLVVIADPLEGFLFDVAVDAIVSPRLDLALAGHGESRRAELAGRVERAEAGLAELADLWGSGDLTRTEWDAARRPLRSTLGAAARDLAVLDGLGGLGALPRTRGELGGMRGDPSRMRQVVAAVIESVTVMPARPGLNFFDPARVAEPVWRA